MLKKIILGGVALVLVLLVALNFIARKSVEIGTERVTGFPLTIGSMKFGLFTSKIDVRDIKLRNPPEFSEPMFAELPQLYIDYSLPSIVTGKNHIHDMIVEVKQIVIVKNAHGESNALKLKAAVSSGEGSTKYQIDRLRVKCAGQVIIQDFSRAKPTERTMPLNVSAEYKNISDSTDVTRLVLLTVMSQVKLPDLGIKAEDLKKNLGSAVKGVGDTLNKAGEGIFEKIKSIGGDDGK